MLKATLGLNVFNRSAAENQPVNLFGYNVNVNAIAYPGQHAYIFVSRFDYLRINENDFLNFGFVHGRANFLRDRQINYETFGQYSYDNFRRLNPRWVVGGAVRHHLIREEKITLTVGVGGIYEFERWQHPFTDEFVEVSFLKSSNYFTLRATLNEFVDFNTVNYYQVGYDQAAGVWRHRLNGSLNVNTKITSRFSLTNAFDISYEDKPIIPITRLIYSFRAGMSVDL